MSLLAACGSEGSTPASTEAESAAVLTSQADEFAVRGEVCEQDSETMKSSAEAQASPLASYAAVSPDLARAPGGSRAAQSIHRFIWGDSESFAGNCPIDIEVRIASSGQIVSIGSDLPDDGEYLVPIPDSAGETAQVIVTNTCTGESREVDEEFLITPSTKLDFAEWELLNEAAQFPRRDGAGALVYKNRMWIIGGWNPDDRANFPYITSNAVWSSLSGRNWRREKCNSHAPEFVPDWEGRHSAGYAVFNDRMVVMGGDFVSGHYQSDVWSSDSGQTWVREEITGHNPFDRRLLFQTFVHQDKLCVYGGQTLPQLIPDETILYSDIWCSVDMRVWEQIEDAQAPPARSAIAGNTVTANEVWILGGGIYHTPHTSMRKFNDVWVSSDLHEWTRVLEHAPWEPRLYHNVTVFNGRLWVIAGVGQGMLGDVWYSDDGFNWYEMQPPWAPRHASSVFVYQGFLWVVAGGPGVSGWHIANDVWRLRPCPLPTCRDNYPENR